MQAVSSIRVLAICVFRRGTKILVARGYDSVKDDWFLRPIGGEVEFGELAAEAVKREVREELRAETTGVVQLGVLENVFTYQGKPGHEVVLVFDGQFSDECLYSQESLEIHEEDIWEGPAFWLDRHSSEN